MRDEVTSTVPVGVTDGVPDPVEERDGVTGVTDGDDRFAIVGVPVRESESLLVGVFVPVRVTDTVVEAVGDTEGVSDIVIGLSRSTFA